MNIESLELAVF